MTSNTIIDLGLANQQITGSGFTNPEDLVGWMGCIQAQEYASAKWAIGCRIKGKITHTEIEELFNEGKFI